MKCIKMTIILIISICLSHCASLQSVSITSIPKDRSKPVEAIVEKEIIFYFNFETDYADQVAIQLRNQCQGGVVSGILTKSESICYVPIFCFLIINKITAKGYCQQ